MEAISTFGENRFTTVKTFWEHSRYRSGWPSTKMPAGTTASQSARAWPMHVELASRIARRRHHAALVRFTTNPNGLAFECRIEELFHRREKRVHIEVEYGPHVMWLYRRITTPLMAVIVLVLAAGACVGQLQPCS